MTNSAQKADPDVCTGSLALEGPIIAADLHTMNLNTTTSDLFCITVFGLCSFPNVTPYTPTLPSPRPGNTRPAVSGQPPIQIVQFSDIHVDLFYQNGSNYNCTKPICCREYTPADAPGNTSYRAGPYGNPNCDAPITLEDRMYQAIKKIAPNATATLFTGDIVDHAVWLTNETQNIIDINDAYRRMTGLAQVFGVVGNHEASPVNAYPSLANPSASAQQQWVYETLSSDWVKWAANASTSSATSFGGYSAMVTGTNLRIISINTNLYYTGNYYLYQPKMESDPSGQLAWLISELAAAEAAGQRAYIIGHMPMGTGDAFHDGSNYFDQIVNRFSATIAALFFGKNHPSSFDLF